MLVNMRGSYLHFKHDRSADWHFLEAWEPSIVHLMIEGSHSDPESVSTNLIRRVHDVSPRSRIMLRCWDVDDRRDPDRPGTDAHAAMYANPIAEAEKQMKWWASVVNRCEASGVPRSLLMAGLNNETPPDMDEQLFAYSERALQRSIDYAVPLGVFVFSVGRCAKPGEGYWDMTRFSLLSDLILKSGSAVMLNEYMQKEGMYGVWTDAQGNERHDWGNLMGRHLSWPSNLPIIIGEWGLDGLLWDRDRDPVYGHSGWLNFPALWPPVRYADEYAAYINAAGLNVIGVCSFISDWADKRWQSFDVMPAYDQLLARKRQCEREVSIAPGSHELTLPYVVNNKPPTSTSETTQSGDVPILVHPVYDPAQRIVMQPYGPSSIDYSMYTVDGVPLKGHTGIDFGTANGSVIVAVDDGKIVEIGDEGKYGYGRYVKLEHAWGESLYAHLQSVLVPKGKVSRGQPIAHSDNTGNSSGPHLHFAMRVYPFTRSDGWGGFRDPQPFLLDAMEAPTMHSQPSANILAIVKDAAAEFALDWRVLLAQVFAESSFNVTSESSTGNKGLMNLGQLAWNDWADTVGAKDIWNARDNVRVGAAYMRWLMGQTPTLYDALVAFGWGIGNFQSGGEPPQKWQAYAQKILFAAELLKGMSWANMSP